MTRRSWMTSIAASVLLAWTLAAPAQTWPDRPIKLVVTFPAGGGADFVGRALAPKLTEALGQPVVVDNRGGANGAIGNEAVAKSAPDGYTLLLGAAGALTIAPHLYAKQAVDTFRDFIPVSLVGSSPFVLAVNPSVPAKTVAELTALAKANPGKLNCGSSGTGGAPHLACELYKSVTGAQIVHVPYKGLAPAITDLLGGNVQVLFADIGLIAPHVKAGTLRALAVTGTQRTPALPEVPTMIEAGVPGYTAGTWYGVLAPAGTPPAIVKRLNTDIAKALASPDLRAQFADQAVVAAGGTPEEFAALIRADYDKWGKVIKDANIKAE
ncbi:MAG TPA: tripartite tricarboxylate transporter substrate binding protein [Casimicrobiaceae bacterium]|nr:tripartite tricarboxylate transporter substrate binding protein [Casimicrobiaceae bacterium]